LTIVLRIPILYGLEDDRFIVYLLDNMWKGQHHVQIGEDRLKYGFLYDGKAVEAHILAGKTLIKESITAVGNYGEPNPSGSSSLNV
jgi:sterol-4alpha-carboxylate 3-dehydrogenase (decarboxylating)